MEKRSAGRVALVTGGARGIGAATAERLAEDGAAVAICDLDGAGAEAAAARIARDHGVPALGLACDVGVAAEVDRLVALVAARLGSLDILVNNAGITRDNLIHKMSEEDWDAVSLVHLKGAVLCARAAQRGDGQAQLGTDHQFVFGCRPRQSRPDQLRDGQGPRAATAW